MSTEMVVGGLELGDEHVVGRERADLVATTVVDGEEFFDVSDELVQVDGLGRVALLTHAHDQRSLQIHRML